MISNWHVNTPKLYSYLMSEITCILYKLAMNLQLKLQAIYIFSTSLMIVYDSRIYDSWTFKSELAASDCNHS